MFEIIQKSLIENPLWIAIDSYELMKDIYFDKNFPTFIDYKIHKKKNLTAITKHCKICINRSSYFFFNIITKNPIIAIHWTIKKKSCNRVFEYILFISSSTSTKLTDSLGLKAKIGSASSMKSSPSFDHFPQGARKSIF